MQMQIQDALLPMLVAAVIGLLAGAGFAAGLMALVLQRRAVAKAETAAEPPPAEAPADRAAPDAPASPPRARVEPVRPVQPASPVQRAQPVPAGAAKQTPLTRPAQPSVAVAPPPRPPAAPTPAALPYAADLLVVDDSAVARVKLRRLFEAAGYRVQLANDGVEALGLLQQGRYALMLTDLEMPNMDGIALISACQRAAPTAAMPILAITGHESLRARFNDCQDIEGIHRKPWVDDILLSHVAALVSVPARQAAVAIA